MTATTTSEEVKKPLQSECRCKQCPELSSKPSCSPPPPPPLPPPPPSTRAIRTVFETIFGENAYAPIGEISPEEPLPQPLTSINRLLTNLQSRSSSFDKIAADLRIEINLHKKKSDAATLTSVQESVSVPSSPLPLHPAPKTNLAPSLSSPLAKQSEAIHAFLITQDYFTYTCEFLQSAILNGVVPHLVGFGGPGPGRGILNRGVIFNWGLGKPILSLRLPIETLVKRLGGDTLVLITDAHDSLLQTSGSALALKFRSFQARFPMARVAIAAERSCFPITEAECARFPQTDPPALPYRNLNSGTWIGEGQHILNVLDAIELMYPNGISNYTMNDQAALQYLYLDEFARRFLGLQLDYMNELFMCLHMAQDDIEKHPHAPYRTCNRLSGACPAVLHFNGGSKDMQQPIEAEISSSLAVSDTAVDGEAIRKVLANYELPELDVSFRSFCCDPRWVNDYIGNKKSISSMRCGKNESNWAV